MTAENQKAQTEGVRDFYQDVQRADRNLALSGGKGIVNHHFGIGQIDWSKYTDIPSQGQIAEIINNLELNQINTLTNIMGPVLPEHKVLDAGSGRGGTAFSIVNKFCAQVTGITIAPYQAGFSQELEEKFWHTGKANFLVMDMLELGFDENTFDHVITNETTMYIGNLNTLFTGFRRVLKPNGRYTLSTWFINENYEGRENLVEKINSHYSGTKMHTRQEYHEALATSGLSEIESKDLTHDAIPHWEIRSKWDQASGIEPAFLEGHRIGKLAYLMISSEKE